jgi:hypothetical protein
LSGSLASDATFAIHLGKLHSTGSRRRQRNCRLIGKFWRPDFGLFVVNGPSEYLACNPPKTAKLAIGFVAEQFGEVTLLTTETRVYCPDRYSLMMFFPIG